MRTARGRLHIYRTGTDTLLMTFGPFSGGNGWGETDPRAGGKTYLYFGGLDPGWGREGGPRVDTIDNTPPICIASTRLAAGESQQLASRSVHIRSRLGHRNTHSSDAHIICQQQPSLPACLPTKQLPCCVVCMPARPPASTTSKYTWPLVYLMDDTQFTNPPPPLRTRLHDGSRSNVGHAQDSRGIGDYSHFPPLCTHTWLRCAHIYYYYYYY